MGQAQTIDRPIFQQQDCEPLTRADLPPHRHPRWPQRQKKLVVLAVQSGLLPLLEAMARYELSIEEFRSWERDFGPRRSIDGGRNYRAENYQTGKIIPLAVH